MRASSNDTDKAIAAYENLTKLSPDDTDAQFALARFVRESGQISTKREKRLDKMLAADPKNIDALYARGRVEIEDGKPQAALDFLNKGLSLAIKSDNKQEKGNILNALGIAVSQTSENRRMR